MKIKNVEQNALNLNQSQLFEFVIHSFDLSEQIKLITEMLNYHAKSDTKITGIQLIQAKIENRIAIPTNEGYELISVNDIIRIEGDSNYCWVHHTQRGKLIVSRTLKDFETKLSKFHFIRVHNSHLVNVKFIEKYSRTEQVHLVMRDGSIIPVSKRKKVEIQGLFI